MLTLYHSDSAVCAAKVRIVLAEKAIPWQGKRVDLKTGGQFAPDYLKLNPNGVVPTLVHDGAVITESTIINEYLDEAFAQTPLRPADPVGRARVRVWTKREDTIHDAINTMTAVIVFRHELMQKSPEERAKRYQSMPDPAKREKWRVMLEKGLDAPYVREALTRFARLYRDMEHALAEGPWLTGQSFTLADVGLISFFYRLEALDMGFTWSETFPRVADWFERCKTRPSVLAEVLGPIPQSYLDHYGAIAARTGPQVRRAYAEALASI